MMNVLVLRVRDGTLWSMLFADRIVLGSVNHDEVERKAKNWEKALDDRGLKTSGKKSEYIYQVLQ